MLSVIATPIGNVEDLSPRARHVLAEAALVLAEDTRLTGRLLQRLGMSASLRSLHEHNEEQRIPEVLARLQAGEHVALVADSGTPLISDPGYRLVRAVRQAGLAITPVPGPCAAIAALSVAGLPCGRFVFEGFLPARAAARRSQLEALANDSRTLVFYEAPHRLRACLADMEAVFGGAREACVARELTKLHESLYRGSLAELAAHARADPNMCRGEIVVVVAGTVAADRGTAAAHDALLGALLAELPLKQAVGIAARVTGCSRNELYRRALELASEAT